HRTGDDVAPAVAGRADELPVPGVLRLLVRQLQRVRAADHGPTRLLAADGASRARRRLRGVGATRGEPGAGDAARIRRRLLHVQADLPDRRPEARAHLHLYAEAVPR